jgi:hypothetical protein
MPTKEEYQNKYNKIKTTQDWVDLLNDDSLNYFELTESLSNYKPGNPTFWKIAEVCGDWTFDLAELPAPTYLATDIVNDNMAGSERPVLEKSGYDYGYDRHNTGPLTQRIVDVLELKNVHANINVQPPGSVKNLHIDTLTCFYNHGDFSNLTDLKFDLATRQPKDYPTMYRLLVALSDWQPGWMFQLGVDQWVGWKKGDVIAIDWQNVAHCTANASFVQRPLLKITASAKNNWIQKCIDSGQIRKFTV